MKTDDQVIEDAIPIVENQWCQGIWYDSDTKKYCAIGAVQKAAQTYQGEIGEIAASGASAKKIDQVMRVARRLADVIEEQYPQWWEGLIDYQLGHPTAPVELFNDQHTREEMLEIFEKAHYGNISPA